MNITLNVNFGLSEDLKALLLQGVAAISAARSSDVSSDTAEQKPEPAKRSPRKAAEKAQPTPPADPAPEAAAQDAADEAAEQQAKADAAKEKAVAEGKAEPTAAVVTIDDMRSAAGAYAKLYGMPAAQEDGGKIIAIEGVKALSKVPEDQIAAVTQRFRDALEQNPYGREKVA